ncbi:hypothetical protein M758_6G203200 [Ceratodon purpureus]|uniref:Uncharacterized protein n=1 Tax=Ceratodon purpureus TaxID=3225 RepID=A0A8T0HK35_CERPU|nr:hypothetical protein KC19_6G212300 [Ceratodon purpureus]KAG0614789.1 hypothetical protein M758_6G203200 [Ceratodon purpureus]
MWNEIGASGAIAMLGMLEKNHSLTELKLAGNNIPCQLLEQIDSLLQTNRTRQVDPDDCTDDLVHPAVICCDGGSRVSSLKITSECPQLQRRSSNCAEPAARGSQIGRDSRISDNSVKIIQDELQMIRKNLADVKSELDDLHKQKDEVTNQLEASRDELKAETKRREQVERDLEESRMEFSKTQQELKSLQEKLHASASESSEKIAALETETMGRRESERATLEREAEVSKQNQYLTDQLAMLREDSDKRIQAMEAKSKSEAEYNAGLVQKLEGSIAERDQKHLQEVEALRSQLTAEIDSLKSLKDNLMMEIEKQKANTKLAEQQLVNQQQVLQQEKEAVQEELKRQKSMHMVEIEEMQHHLEEKDKEHAKAKQKHEESMQALENDLRKERASVTRAELSKSNAEQNMAAMEADMDHLKEKYKAEQERAILLELNNRADELKHNSSMAALSSKHSEEQEKMKGDLLLHRKQIEAMIMQNREMQAEHERRMKDMEIQLRGAETAIVEWIQQQFSALQAALSFHATVPAIEYGTLRSSQINADTAIDESGGAIEEPPRMSQRGSSPLSPRVSRSSQSKAKTSPAVSPRISQVSQTVARTSPASTPRACRTSLSMVETAPPPASRYSRTTSQILSTPETIPPGSRNCRSIAEPGRTYITPSLSVTNLVPPVYEEVGTVDEDLVSSGGESVNTEDF